MPATDGTWRATWTRFATRWSYAAQLVFASEFIGLAIGIFLVARRATGAISTPLPPLPLTATVFALVTWSLLIHLLWRGSHAVARSELAGDLRSPDSLVTIWLPLLTILLFAVACSYPGDRWIDWLAWPSAIAALVWSSRALVPARRGSAARGRGPMASERVLQQLTRIRTAEGKEAVRGALVVEFAAGQRDATLYVAFCPPFERQPDVDAHIADEPLAAVKVTEPLHHGAQLDVRLADPAEEPLTVTVEFFAAERERPTAP